MLISSFPVVNFTFCMVYCSVIVLLVAACIVVLCSFVPFVLHVIVVSVH